MAWAWKRRLLPATLALSLLLTACGGTQPAGPEQSAPPTASAADRSSETPETAHAPKAADPAFSPELDLEGLEAAMPAADYAALTQVLPVLQGEQRFYLMDDLWEGASQLRETTLPEYRDDLFDGNYLDHPEKRPASMTMNGLTVQDVTGDGAPEVILSFEDFGWFYLLFHQEGDQVYAADLSVRSFERLQTNGVFFGSGGAGDTTYYRLSFRDGLFAAEELAHKTIWSGGVTCALGGREATEADYDAWCAENLVGDAYWYAADGSAGFWSAQH